MTNLLDAPTITHLRPRYEGNNICTWIGFKHVNYLVEEAVLEHFRAAGFGPGRLYAEHGLGLDIVDLDTRILRAFHLDDACVATVLPGTPAGAGELSFAVTLAKDGAARHDVAATASVVLRRDTATGPVDAPDAIAPFTVDRIGDDGGDAAPENVLETLLSKSNAVGWTRRVPYFYCHFNERMQMSGYLRQMEDAVDRFLAERGISIRQLLQTRRWIPVVPHSRVRILDETLMEEDLHTVFSVEEVFKDLTYRSRMDSYVVRDGRLVRTATGTITHGYAVIENRRDWKLVPFDERVLAALRGRNSG